MDGYNEFWCILCIYTLLPYFAAKTHLPCSMANTGAILEPVLDRMDIPLVVLKIKGATRETGSSNYEKYAFQHKVVY